MNKAGSRRLLALQPTLETAPAPGLWVSGTPGKQGGRPIRQGALHGIHAPIEGFHLLQQLHRLKLIDRTCIRLIARPHRIAGETQQVADPQRMGPEQVGLKGDAIAIPAGHLQHRLQTRLKQQLAGGQAAHPHHGPTAIGHIHRMDTALQRCGHGQHVRRIGSARRHHLGREHLIPGLNRALQRRLQVLFHFTGPLCRIRPIVRTTMFLTVASHVLP